MIELAQLPPTALLLQVQERGREMLGRPDLSQEARQRITRMLAYYELALIPRANLRDDLARERPEGCTCLGTGINNPRYLPVSTGLVPLPDQPLCECSDAIAIRSKASATIEQRKRDRRQERIARIFARCGIPKDFADCTLGSHPPHGSSEALARIRAYLEDGAEGSLFLWGGVGRGKTATACALAKALVERDGCDLLFVTAPDLWDRIRATYDRRRDSEFDPDQVLEAAKTVSLLVFDDLGAERGTDWEQEKLFTIVNARRNEQLRTIYTSNLDLADLAYKLGERTANRIRRMCEGNIVEFTGPNLLVPGRAEAP